MTLRGWLGAVAITGLLCSAVSGGAQTVTYQRDASGHWVAVSAQGGLASAVGGPYAHPMDRAPIAAGPKDAAGAASAVRPAVATEPRMPALPTASGVAVAAVVPPSAASNRAPATLSSSPAVAAPAASASSSGASSEGERLYLEALANAARNPLNWSVHIYKSRHLMQVYYKGHPYKTYHAVFGRSRWAGAKEWEGDMRTPEGDYLIIDKRRSRRFGWFLALNYPNAIDHARFVHLRAMGKVPRRAREGGDIGIHGTEIPLLNVGDINWTTGCISVDNGDIAELDRLLPVGTLVVISP